MHRFHTPHRALGVLAMGLVFWIGSAGTAAASAPAAAWGMIDDVTVTSWDMGKGQIRETLVLSGAFSIGTEKGYAEPQWGYFHYVCPTGQEEICQLEWADLEKAIGECRGYGDFENPAGTLHAPGTPLDHPDLYPIAYGVVQGWSQCQQVLGFVEENARPDALAPSDLEDPSIIGPPSVPGDDPKGDPKGDPADPTDPVDDPALPGDDPTDPADPAAPVDDPAPGEQDPGAVDGGGTDVPGEIQGTSGEPAGCAGGSFDGGWVPVTLLGFLLFGLATRRRRKAQR